MSVVAIIGGTGLYELDAMTDRRWVHVDSPFGATSDDILCGRIGEQDVAFLPRHGRGHRIPPHAINYRANIDALKRVGATCVLSVSAVGSLKDELAPGTFVLVDQFIDRTLRGGRTFFEDGCVAHVSMASPTCGRMRDVIARASSVPVVPRGTYVVMEGPQFSTRAESELHRSWGADVIGMTNMPEAKLAREAELCYATVAMVTDYDCWRPNDDVTAKDIVAVVKANADKARALVTDVVGRVAAECECQRALDTALLTPLSAITPEVARKLSAVAGRVLV